MSDAEWYSRMADSEGIRRRRYVETRRIADLREARGNQCRRCGSRVKLEFAHVKPTKVKGMGRGQQVRYGDIKRNPDAYELLCRDCHRAFDRKGGYNAFFGLLLVEWLEGGRNA
jgi:DNA-directed RNA polymerase subunit RPC12/RpoP